MLVYELMRRDGRAALREDLAHITLRSTVTLFSALSEPLNVNQLRHERAWSFMRD